MFSAHLACSASMCKSGKGRYVYALTQIAHGHAGYLAVYYFSWTLLISNDLSSLNKFQSICEGPGLEHSSRSFSKGSAMVAGGFDKRYGWRGCICVNRSRHMVCSSVDETCRTNIHSYRIPAIWGNLPTMKDVPSIKIGPLKYYNTNGVAWYIIIAHAHYMHVPYLFE